jgi:NTE family protein
MATLHDALAGRRFGAVLSAGFFGFYGHAGFTRALLESGLTPAAWAGSSAGGLVAAFAAAGLPPLVLCDHILGLKRQDFWDVQGPRALLAGLRGDHGLSGLLTGDRFLALLRERLPVQATEACPTPLRLVTTNLTRGRVTTFARGDLAKQIVASCAYPGLFRAVEIDGDLHWDGGLVDKAPLLALADEAKELGLEALLVHYLPSRVRDRIGGALAYAHGLDIGMAVSRREHFRLQVQVCEARGLPVYIVVSELPKVSPTRLTEGVRAMAAGRAAGDLALESDAASFLKLPEL